MPDRDAFLKLIDDAYAARVRGDKEALAQVWADGASFRISAAPLPVENLSFHHDEPMQTAGDLMDRFWFSDLTRLDAVVEGNQAAVRWGVTVGVEGKAPVHTELMDLIEVDDGGRIRSLVQFVDTAAMLRLLQ